MVRIGVLTWPHGLAAVGAPLDQELEQLAAQGRREVQGRHQTQLLRRARRQRRQAAPQLLRLQGHLCRAQQAHTSRGEPPGQK